MSFALARRCNLASKLKFSTLHNLADLRLPHTWYPKARAFQREFIYHMGPTNSGKTFAALNRLKAAKSGVYCAPLRLLAGEIADKLNGEGIKCSMITGQERILVEGATHLACTIEMLDMHWYYDCAIIDEIQMLEDEGRGSSWTAAVLGVLSPEIHLTGDFRASEIMKKLIEDTGDKLKFETYSRLSPLRIIEPIENLEDLEVGDCLIAFSRKTCHKLKTLIHTKHPASCSIIYGNLPPEARREQARKFNDREGVKFLVATDAIGMGLNYNINRVIFYTTEKHDGKHVRSLFPQEIKQIAGRAGRYNKIGSVTTTNIEDMHYLRTALNSNQTNTIAKAAIFPTYEQLMEFKAALEDEHGAMPFIEMLNRFVSAATLDKKYFLESIEEVVEIAHYIHDLPLSTQDLLTFCKAPVRTKFHGCMKALRMFAEAYSNDDEVKVRVPSFSSKDSLERLEIEYAIYDMYIWLSYKFPSFTQRDLARSLVVLCAEKINDFLTSRPLISLKRKQRKERKRYTDPYE
mmetsp:Transcript_29115/g.52084  ORF Transcript_29115/g.52084 Transcript_29115/m.52084 type:complete len:518 (+) Transcript_29115:1-1554(+)